MSGNGIELRTLPLAIGIKSPSKKAKSVKSKGKKGGPKSGKIKTEKDDVISQATGFVSGFNKKEETFDINMNTSKKTEKKTGLREWFMGKTAKSPKPKLSNTARPDSIPVGPIVERLQKQSAYLTATMQEERRERGAQPSNNLSPDHDQLNYDEFIHKRHLFQNHSRPTFCDVCDDFILGIYKSAIRCKCK